MKKWLKVTISTVLFLLVAGAGVVYYFLNIKEYDVADEKVEEITESKYNVDLPDLESTVPAQDESNTEDVAAAGETTAENGDSGSANAGDSAAASSSSSDTGTTASSNKGTSKSIAGNSGAKNSGGKQKDTASNSNEGKKPAVTAETIKAAYRPSFESLEAQANAKIDALVNNAYGEYNTKKQNGESVSITYFYKKYTSAGAALESNTNETFNYIYSSLENDLETRGYSKSEAAEFKTQYENAKKARESALIEKAKSAL